MLKNIMLIFLFIVLVFIPANGEELSVLFDNCHDESISNANWTITGGFSDFAESFKNMGFKVDEIKTKPINYDLISKYTVFVIGEPNTRFSDDEETAILNYVKNGGKLYVIADHTNSDRNNDGFDSVKIFNRFSKNFGFVFQEAWIGNLAPIKINEKNEILNNVDNVGIWGGTIAEITDSVKAKGHINVTYKDRKNGEIFEGPYLVLAEYGKGRVVGFGDSSPYDDGTADDYRQLVHDGYNQVDYGHRQLARNTINWLLGENIESAKLPLDIKLGVDKLNTEPGKIINIPFKLHAQNSGTVKIRYFIKKIKEKNLLLEKEMDIVAGINDISFPFKYSEFGLLKVYVTAEVKGVKEVARAFTTVKVGKIPRLCLDMSHENDWCNRIKAFRAFIDREGIFYSSSRKDLPRDLAKTDTNIAIITAPKKGKKLESKDIVAVIDFLKRDGVLVLIGSSDSAFWGDGNNLMPLVEALNLPLQFNDDTVKINDPLKANTLVTVNNESGAPRGERPTSLIPRKNGVGKIRELCFAPDGSTNFDGDKDGFIDLTGKKILIDAEIDLSETKFGAGVVILFGSSHITDKSLKPDADNETEKYLNYCLKGALPKK